MKKNKEQTMNSNRRSKNNRNTTSLRKKGGDERSNKAVRSRRSTVTKPNVSSTAKNNKKLREYSKRKSSETVSLSRSMSVDDDDKNIHDTGHGSTRVETHLVRDTKGVSHLTSLRDVEGSLTVGTQLLTHPAAKPHSEVGERRRSSRFTGENIVYTFALGNERTSNDISDDTIQQFINTYIQVDKPVVISLPVSPQRHAFLVYVTPSNKIMIADWYLRKYKKIVGYQKSEAWKTYNRFMELLRETYPDYTMDFFPIDKEIQTEADIHHKDNNNSLGCSFYIYKWIKQHQRDLL